MKRINISKEDRKNIRIEIVKRNMSYKEIGELIGISSSTICRICNGTTKYMSCETVNKLRNILGISIEEANKSLEARIEKLEKENMELKELSKCLKKILEKI